MHRAPVSSTALPLVGFYCLVSKNGREFISQHPLCKALPISVKIEAVCGFNHLPAPGPHFHSGWTSVLQKITCARCKCVSVCGLAQKEKGKERISVNGELIGEAVLHLPSRLQGSCICGSHLLRVTHGGVSTRPSWTHQPGARQDPRHGPNAAAIRPGLRMEAPQAGNSLGGFYSRDAESERDPKVVCCPHPAPFNNRESGWQEPGRDESSLCPSTPGGSWLARSQHRDAVVPRHALAVPPWRVL